ncbi:type II secretion system minor pseudopilin GspK [Endozoicomonas sp. Mp262]|uniref:type II secretion system minor pseudopilin GspK n=1 Tax=Endozoicomonas sp. Mp262 TaxID=2919499 RepID=UPI0021D9F07C
MNQFLNSRYSGQQKGVALLYVLLLFSMITLMASQIVTNLLLHTEKNSRFLERTQAKHYALGAEQYVAYLLEEDFIEDKKNKKQVDHESKRWNIKNVDYAVEQGYIEIAVVDEQSRFNINWLTAEGTEGKKFLKMFQNLLVTQAIDIDLASRIQEWLGAAPDSAKGVAADNKYLVMEPPRRAANTEMVSISELRLIEGLTDKDFELLSPLVTALPLGSKINLNTAQPEVIRSISDKLTEGDAMAIIDGRGNEGFTKIEELGNIAAIKDKMADIKAAPVSVFSQYFSTYIKATYRDTTFYLKTLLVRTGEGRVQIAGREIGPNSYWVNSTKDS